MTLGEKLREARDRAEMTQQELAKKTGFHIRSIQIWESDKADPSFFNLCCIASVLHLSLDYLAGFSKDKYLK